MMSDSPAALQGALESFGTSERQTVVLEERDLMGMALYCWVVFVLWAYPAWLEVMPACGSGDNRGRHETVIEADAGPWERAGT